jgi:hypothetical protein
MTRIAVHLLCLSILLISACAEDTIDHWRNTTPDLRVTSDSSIDTISSPFNIVPVDSENSVNAIWGLASDDLWAVGDGGIVLHRNAAGWTSSTTEILVQLRALWGRSNSDIWAVGVQSWVHYDGNAWSLPVADPKGPSLLALWGTGDTIWGVGTSGAIMYNTSSSSVWQEMPQVMTSGDLLGLWGSSDSNIWAIGLSGAAAHYDGQGWTTASILNGDTQQNLRGIHGQNESDIWVVGDAGFALHYDGNGWSQSNTATNADLHAVWGNSADSVWAVGNAGTILHWQGSSWKALASGTSEDLRHVWGISNTLWVTGGAGTLLRHDDVGAP